MKSQDTRLPIGCTHGEDMLVVIAFGLAEKMDLIEEAVESVDVALAWKKGLL